MSFSEGVEFWNQEKNVSCGFLASSPEGEHTAQYIPECQSSNHSFTDSETSGIYFAPTAGSLKEKSSNCTVNDEQDGFIQHVSEESLEIDPTILERIEATDSHRSPYLLRSSVSPSEDEACCSTDAIMTGQLEQTTTIRRTIKRRDSLRPDMDNNCPSIYFQTFEGEKNQIDSKRLSEKISSPTLHRIIEEDETSEVHAEENEQSEQHDSSADTPTISSTTYAIPHEECQGEGLYLEDTSSNRDNNDPYVLNINVHIPKEFSKKSIPLNVNIIKEAENLASHMYENNAGTHGEDDETRGVVIESEVSQFSSSQSETMLEVAGPSWKGGNVVEECALDQPSCSYSSSTLSLNSTLPTTDIPPVGNPINKKSKVVAKKKSTKAASTKNENNQTQKNKKEEIKKNVNVKDEKTKTRAKKLAEDGPKGRVKDKASAEGGEEKKPTKPRGRPSVSKVDGGQKGSVKNVGLKREKVGKVAPPKSTTAAPPTQEPQPKVGGGEQGSSGALEELQQETSEPVALVKPEAVMVDKETDMSRIETSSQSTEQDSSYRSEGRDQCACGGRICGSDSSTFESSSSSCSCSDCADSSVDSDSDLECDLNCACNQRRAHRRR